MPTINKRILIFILIAISFFVLPVKKNCVQARDWDKYTRDGIYYVTKNGKDVKCGRVGEDNPLYQKHAYGEAKACWDHRCEWGMCKGEIPLCCYKLEEKKDPYACAWPERAYCLPQQCKKIKGDNLLCAHAIGYWCHKDCNMKSDASEIPYISFEDRFTQTSATTQPTATPKATTPKVVSSTSSPTKKTPRPSSTPSPLPTAPKVPTETPAPTHVPQPFSLTTIIPTIKITPTPTSSFNFKINSEKIKTGTRNIILSSNKILDLPKAIFEDITRLDKKLEAKINNFLSNFPFSIFNFQ